MAKDPAFLFYPNDWIGGTMGMTFEEKGAYMELLMLQFNRGHMTEHMIGLTIGQMFGRIKDKFIQDKEGLWYNDRLELEKNKRKSYVESRYNNKSGLNQHKNKKSIKSGHMTIHMENENENVNNINTLHNKVKQEENFLKEKTQENGKTNYIKYDQSQGEHYLDRRVREARIQIAEMEKNRKGDISS